jgi:hypothetical protein
MIGGVKMRNIYDFDWNLMAKLDPSYLQYLEDVNQIKLEEDETYGLNPGDPNIHGFNARELRQLAREEEADLDTDYRAAGLTEEERAIVEMMHNGDKAPVEEGGVIEGASLLSRVRDAVMATSDDIEPKYRLKAEYRDYPVRTSPIVPLLPPPKRVLSPGSEFWFNDNIHYEIHSGSERNEDVVWLIKQKLYRKPNKVGMLKATYRLDRLHDASQELKKMFRLVVYNLETARLYYITGQDNGKHKRITKKITQMGLNKNGTDSLMSVANRRLTTKFVEIVLNHVIKQIPDLYIPPQPERKVKQLGPFEEMHRLKINDEVMEIVNDSAYRGTLLYTTMLQHKVGHRLEWLSDANFINNVSEFASQRDLTSRLIGGKHVSNEEEQREAEKRDTKLKRKTLYTVFPNLRERPGAKTVTKSLFGPYHKKFFHKILTWKDVDKDFFINAVNFLMDIVYATNKGVMPNDLYHLIVALVKRGDAISRRQLGQISILLSDLRGNQWEVDPQPDPETVRKAGFYTRTVRNIMPIWDTDEAAVNEVVKWHTFRDMLDMASELNIRVRVNKFHCAQDVMQLHDRFSFFQQRDLEAYNKFDMYDFLPFESPDKEYGGFRFLQLLTPAALVDEGKTMRHCVGGYSERCLTGKSIIYSMFKDRSWITIEINGADLTIQQKYTIRDFTVQNREINQLILDWHADLNRMHQNDKEPYQVRALAYYEYQKARQKIQRLESMNDDDLGDDEKSWLARSLQNAKEVLEKAALTLNMEDTNATINEQVYATA